MTDVLLVLFVLTVVYLMAKPLKSTPKKPTSTPAKAEQAAAGVASKSSAKKASPAKKAPKKPTAVAIEPAAATPEISAQERTGLIAGSIWQYLEANGATSVAKLIKELPDDEKYIQRSIGWLAQEDKITLSIVGRVETIALKE